MTNSASSRRSGRQVKKQVPYEYQHEEEKIPLKKKVPAKPQAPKKDGGEKEDKYYKKFDFFYKRTCFRLMAEFYKHAF